MANYKKLTDVEVMEEVSENTMALVEENGKLKKVPCGKGFGGGSGIPTAIMISNVYKEYLFSAPAPSSVLSVREEQFSCINMTFEEACNILANYEPLDIVVMSNQYFEYGQGEIQHAVVQFVPGAYIPYIAFKFDRTIDTDSYKTICYWSEQGITPWVPGVDD